MKPHTQAKVFTMFINHEIRQCDREWRGLMETHQYAAIAEQHESDGTRMSTDRAVFLEHIFWNGDKPITAQDFDEFEWWPECLIAEGEKRYFNSLTPEEQALHLDREEQARGWEFDQIIKAGIQEAANAWQDTNFPNEF